ncbi:MAG: endonuclease/exonuclease/phosphatase family protein [Pyrinomonadaceae bacterium]
MIRENRDLECRSVLARLPVVLRWIELRQPDVVCLQETKCIDDKFPRQAFEDLGYRAEIFGQPTYNGVAILSRTPGCDVQRNFPESLAREIKRDCWRPPSTACASLMFTFPTERSSARTNTNTSSTGCVSCAAFGVTLQTRRTGAAVRRL